MASVGQGVLCRAIHAGTWSALGLVVQKVISLGSFFILARLLTPEDYGVIAIVLMVAGVLDTLSTPGFERALIQRQGSVEPYLHVFWTFNLVRSILLAALIYFAAPLIGSFFHLTDLLALSVLRCTGLLIVIQALGNLGNLFFFKELLFRNVFIRDTSGQVAFSVVAIGYALYSPTVFALFAGFLAQNIASVLAQYLLHAHRPRISLAFSRLKDLGRYGVLVMAQNIFNQVNSILETSVVGKLLGPASLGFYSRAVSIASLPSSAITSIVTKVGFPAYAKVQDAYENVMDGLVKSFDIALALMAPFTLIVLFEGNRLVEVFLGPQWLHMVGPMKVLVISFYFKGLCTLIHPLMEGVGKVETRFSFSVLQSLLLFGFLFVLVPKLGAFGAALAALGTYATLCVMFVLWGLIRLRIRLFRFLPALVSVGGATALCALVLMLFHLFGENLNTSLFLMSLTFVGVLYIAVLFLIGRARKTGPAQTLLTILRSVRSQ